MVLLLSLTNFFRVIKPRNFFRVDAWCVFLEGVLRDLMLHDGSSLSLSLVDSP